MKIEKKEEKALKEMTRTIEKLEEIIIDCFLSDEERKAIQKMIVENEEIIKQIKEGKTKVKKKSPKEQA